MLKWKSYKNQPKKVTMRRSVYADVAARGRVVLTTPYVSKQFVLKPGDSKCIELVFLKEINSQDYPPFYAILSYTKSEETYAEIYLADNQTMRVGAFCLGNDWYQRKGRIEVSVVEDI